MRKTILVGEIRKHKDINKSSESITDGIGEKEVMRLHETEISEGESGRHLGLISRPLIVVDTGLHKMNYLKLCPVTDLF